MLKMKDHLASWRHSADSTTNARRSKVIDRRIRDAFFLKAKNHARAREKFEGAADACRGNLKFKSGRAGKVFSGGAHRGR
jgi:hypothetical protein